MEPLSISNEQKVVILNVPHVIRCLRNDGDDKGGGGKVSSSTRRSLKAWDLNPPIVIRITILWRDKFLANIIMISLSAGF